jgi:hypothetical protein
MPRPSRQRTWFTILLSVATILLGGMGSLFSAFALLLAIGKPYANSSADPLGIFVIFILPPSTLLAGIGLLLRWRVARWWMILLMAGVMVFGFNSLVAPSYQKTPNYYSDSLKQYLIVQSTACIAIGGLVLLGLLSRPVRREFSSNPSAPMPTNEPYADGGTASSDSVADENACGRALRASMPLPGEYRAPQVPSGTAVIGTPPQAIQSPKLAPSSSANPQAALPSNDGTILPALAFLLLVAAACFWFASRGLERGEIRLPVKRSSASSMVSRAEEPALFWTSFGVLAVLGSGGITASLWLIAARRSPSRSS